MSLHLGVLKQYPPREFPERRMATQPMLGEELPTISIVTPSFNQVDFIERTIESVLNQKYPKLEYIIQDGCSHDGTIDLLRAYDKRITSWESVPDDGQADALNRGFSRTSGEIMAYLNSDDLLMPGTLAKVADFFQRNEDIDMVYSHRLIIDSEDKEIGRWFLPRHDAKALRYADYIPQETMFWRRSVWEAIGGRIDPSFHFAMDWDLLLRFQEQGAEIIRLPLFLAAFRVHPNSKTQNLIGELGQHEMDRLRLRTCGYQPGYLETCAGLATYLVKAWIIKQLNEKQWLHSLKPLLE